MKFFLVENGDVISIDLSRPFEGLELEKFQSCLLKIFKKCFVYLWDHCIIYLENFIWTPLNQVLVLR